MSCMGLPEKRPQWKSNRGLELTQWLGALVPLAWDLLHSSSYPVTSHSLERYFHFTCQFDIRCEYFCKTDRNSGLTSSETMKETKTEVQFGNGGTEFSNLCEISTQPRHVEKMQRLRGKTLCLVTGWLFSSPTRLPSPKCICSCDSFTEKETHEIFRDLL